MVLLEAKVSMKSCKAIKAVAKEMAKEMTMEKEKEMIKTAKLPTGLAGARAVQHAAVVLAAVHVASKHNPEEEVRSAPTYMINNLVTLTHAR
jgi:uncharacterized protein YoaH (UPF0181 family)